jgi:chromosome partitioning protein
MYNVAALIRAVIANQRGGVGKTTTAINGAAHLANSGYRTLLIDTDTQSSAAVMLNLNPRYFFRHFVLKECSLPQCVVEVSKNFHVLCGNKQTVQAESILASAADSGSTLKTMLEPWESQYGATILDVSPSINLVQTSALIYARNVVIPINMDFLSLNGGYATYETIRHLNASVNAGIRLIGLLPCQVDRRLSVTRLILEGIQSMSQMFGVPVLPGIRTDQNVNRAFFARQPLLEYDPHSKASQDYIKAFDEVIAVIKERDNGTSETAG